MFGSKIYYGFDSATATQAKAKIDELSKAELREMQSIEEIARTLGLSVVIALVYAVTEDKLEGALPSDYLDDLLLEATDDLDIENETAWDLIIASVSDALESLGVDQSMIEEVLGDNIESADSAIESLVDTVLANLPDDGEPLDNFTREFIFGDDDVDQFDAGKGRLTKAEASAKNGAMSVKNFNGKKVVYRGVVAIRKGKRVVVNKRLPNQTVRLTAKQKQALKKAQLKAHTASAISSRLRSMSKRNSL